MSTDARIASAALRLLAERGSESAISASDLATEAGVARGTLYRNVDSLEALFLEVRETVAAEIHELLAQGLDANDMYDEAVRLATGIRMLVRLAHDRPVAGRFIVRFGLSDDSLRELLGGLPMENLRNGAAKGRFDVDPAGEVGVISMLTGTTLSAMLMVLDGYQTWRDAGVQAGLLCLRAVGVPLEEARSIVAVPLPSLPLFGGLDR